ncbi:MAG TPA: DUF3048 domain-containing protein [bacterium]|nr:DUF3048 domain-containing protein [bacterium]
MSLRERLAILGASVAVVLAAAAFAWRGQMIPYNVWIELPPVSLPMPAARTVFAPGEDGVAPLLIVVENTPEARPQSGLADACLVYAVPTEARITRFLASFCDAVPKVVGPVRSVRRYMLEIAVDLGAILVHAGHSGEALAHIRARKIPVLNQFWAPGPFWRDDARRMPHNLYTGVDRLRAQLESHPIGLRPRGVPYAFGQFPAGGVRATAVTLDYGPLYAAHYRYDALRRRYRREQDGRPHTDADGKSIAPTSVIVLFIRWWDVQEPTGPSSKIELVGSGRLAVLADGRLIEGTWSRTNLGPLVLRVEGAPVVIPRGPVWIELFPVDRPFTVVGETQN